MTTRVLFVTHLKLYPAYGGQYIRSYNLIDSLSQRFKVIVLAPQVDDECELLAQVKAWYNLPALDQSFSKKILYYFQPHPIWKQLLQEVCEKHRSQLTWFDYGHWGHYAAIPHHFKSRTLMGTHNIQSRIGKQEWKTNLLSRWHIFFLLHYWAQLAHEHKLFDQFDRIVSVSETDRNYHAKFVGDKHSLLLPNYINEAWYKLEKPIKREKNLIVMTGQFDSFQNRQGLIWFLQKVWPQVHQQIPQIQLQLVGRGGKMLSEVINHHTGIIRTGQVPTVAPYLRRATAVIVPLLHGSGTRFKILEALACGAPIISTTLGAQGVDLVSGKSILLADNGPDFVRAIIDLHKNSVKRTSLAQNGLGVLKKQYGFEVNTQRIEQIVMEVIAQ